MDDRWWCWECHGLGQWEEGEEECSPYDVECWCCGGSGGHDGDVPPKCAPSATPIEERKR